MFSFLTALPFATKAVVTTIAFTAIFGLGLYVGRTLTSNSYKADMLEAQKQAFVEYTTQTEKLNGISAELEKSKNEKQIVYRTITKKVEKLIERPIYSIDCIDADGMQLINSALAGKASDSKELITILPTITTIGRKEEF